MPRTWCRAAEEWMECALECTLRLMEGRGERTIALYGAPGLEGDGRDGWRTCARGVSVSECEGV